MTSNLQSKISVTVAIPFYNNAGTISLAVRSILSQTFYDYELLLIDDGSIDESLKIARAFDDPRIRIYSDGKNLGLAARLNQSVQIARGRYYARMDADDICYPERIAKQVKFLENHPDVDLLGCASIVIDNSAHPVGIFPSKVTHEEITNSPRKGFYFPHPTWMGLTQWFLKNPYDESFPKAQDQELLLRTYRTSRFACVPELLFAYRQERVTFSKAFKGRYNFSRAILKDIRQHRGFLDGISALFIQLLKIIYDFLTLQCKLCNLLESHRVRKILPNQVSQWNAIRSTLQNEGLLKPNS